MHRPAIVILSFWLGSFVTAGTAGEPREEATKKELEKLQGTWQLVSAETDGKKMKDEVAKQIRVVIKGSSHTVYFGDKVIERDVPFKIDPSKKPTHVEDTLKDGQVIRGIFEIKGDMLRTCTGGIGKERPREFASKPGTGQTLRVFRRVKSD